MHSPGTSRRQESIVDARLVSQIFFALTIMAIGVMGLMTGGFAPIWANVPKSLPDRALLAYLCTFVSLACGAGLLARRLAAPAALALFVFLTIWTALFKVPFIIRAPLVEGTYQSCGESVVLVAAALALYVEFARATTFPAGRTGLLIAHLLYGFALIAFGLSHFAYVALTAPLVPAWLPGHLFWAYFTGSLYLLTGASLVTGLFARPGTILAAAQITIITLLVWGPGLLAGHISESDWEETVISWALTAGAWVLATSFGPASGRNRPVLRVFARPRLERG